jgi:hypothetical protein
MPRPSFARLGSGVWLELELACLGMVKASYLVSLAAGHGTESRLGEAGSLGRRLTCGLEPCDSIQTYLVHVGLESGSLLVSHVGLLLIVGLK